MENALYILLISIIILVFNLYQTKRSNAKLILLYRKAREEAKIDPLTGIYNKKHLLERLDEEIGRATRHINNILQVVFIDINDFKKINDTCGHREGDRVLTEIAKTVSKNVRRYDCFGRYGGDEFVLILPETSSKEGRFIAQKINDAIRAIQVNGAPITVSMGICSFDPENPVEDPIALADKAMYQAKDAKKSSDEEKIFVYTGGVS